MVVRNLIYGVGINDRSIPVSKNKLLDKTYIRWCRMLERCYSPNRFERFPTYVGVEVSDTFKSYSSFYNWCNSQAGYDKEGFELDKDILGDGKIYSEQTCCFVPYEINTLFILRGNDRGPYPLGVTKIKKCNTYIARLNSGKERVYLGAFSTPELAYAAYVKAKEDRVKEMAEKYKGQIRQDVYEKLMEYEVKQ